MGNNIAFVIPKLCGGGAERVISNLTTHFPEDWDIDILINNKKRVEYPYRGRLIELNLDSNNYMSVFFQAKVFWKRCHVLKRLKKEKQYKAVISFLDSANVANIVTGKKFCKVIISVRNYISADNSKIYKYLVTPMIKIFYNRADKIVVPSVGIKDDLIKNFKIRESNIKVIPNGYDLGKINELKKLEISSEYNRLFDQGINLINVGRLEKQKGQWHLIRVMSEVVKKYPDTKLLILGQGKLEQYLKNLIKKYGLQSNVFLLGFQNNPFQFMYRSDIYVFSSLFEGFPNALAEALACDLPVISSDFRSGCREILAPGTDVEFEQKDSVELAEFGLIVPVCSDNLDNLDDSLDLQEKILYKAICKLIEDKKLRDKYRYKAKARVCSLDIDNMVKRWLKLLEELCF